MNLTSEIFGRDENGQDLLRWDFDSSGDGCLEGMSCIDFGASLQSVRIGGKEVCLGFDNLEAYRNQKAYIGASVGRYANRIAKSTFELQGRRYQLEANDGQNSLHGGFSGFSLRRWEAEAILPQDRRWAQLRYFIGSEDGQGGYPGNMSCSASYILCHGEHGESWLIMYYEAQCDRLCPINLTNHGYWNLNGEDSHTLAGQKLTLWADSYVDVDDQAIPTGVLAEVGCGQGFMDFRGGRELASVLHPRPSSVGLELQPLLPNGIDHNYVISPSAPKLSLSEAQRNALAGTPVDVLDAHELRLAARVEAEISMEVYTSYPGVQVYTGNFLQGDSGRKGNGEGEGFPRQSALCLEAQYFPDGPNQKDFPCGYVGPDQPYREIIAHRFYHS